ncbi:flagellar basal body P-ring formation chaperone FlgA [Fundidesulfovibrio putealis]|uniref:flagellar basal body P-ring formation chaperone FlgA n=1 Tax=Fundidesulfovibrio putealis TaxID=270496 RepID=UPI00146FC767|nr:flagellar basal body P-ring formation chaperone FlgA [Fundidesulfovibrio putealis]
MSQSALPIRRVGYILAAVCAMVAFLAASSSFGAGVMDWKLKIAPAAAITGERVMLGEIAEPVGQIDAETWRILASTPLWSFPGREGQLTFTRKKILDDLDRLFPGAEQNFAVPEQVVLKKGGGKPVTVSEVDRMIVDYLTANMTGLDGELEVKEITLPGQLFIDKDLERLSVEGVGAMTPGRVNLRLTVTALDGRVLRQIAANAFVNVWKVIPVAGRPLNLKEGVLTPEKITYERRNLALVRGVPWEPKDPTPVRVKSSLNQGTPLTSETVEPMPAILKGTQVYCLWRGPSIQLVMPVTAMTDGAKGSQITVRNVQSGRELAAVVQDAKTVVAR